MNDMSDDHLKEIFGKLNGFESTEKGITWRAIHQHLPKGSLKTRMTRYASVLAILSASFLLVTVNEQRSENQQADVFGSRNTLNPAPATRSSIANPPQTGKFIVYKASLNNDHVERIPDYSGNKANGESISEVKNSSRSRPHSISLERSRIEELTNRPIRVTGRLTENEKPSLVVMDDKKSKEKPLTVSISPSYMFGVVDPLPNDPFLIHTYKSRPGFGLKLETTKEIRLFRSVRVHTGPSFSYLKKSFDFSITQFNPESTSERTLSENYGNSYVGWNFYFESQNHSPWSAGIGFNKHIGKGQNLDRFLGDTFLSLGISRSITQNKSAPFIFKPGLSFSLPLTGKIEYLRYYPIQLTFTIQYAFPKRS